MKKKNKKNNKKRRMKIIKKERRRYCTYLFETGMVKLRKGTNFQKLFHRWYISGSNIVPCRVYDYLEREGIIKK